MRSTKLAMALGALALGTALSAMPALAQDYHVGRTGNDGGFVTNDNSAVKTGQIGPRAPKTGRTEQNSGRGVYNYSGQGFAPAQGHNYSVGRSMNDGGISASQFDSGEQTSGSASNREAKRSNADSYSFGAQGQQPHSVR